jgi:putative ABC transport system permease protein
VAIAATFVVAVGATATRYVTVIQEMSLLFHDQITVVSKDAIVVEALPIGGGMLPQDPTMEKIQEIEGVVSATPVLFVASAGFQTYVQPVPFNFTFGIPAGEWQIVIGPASFRGNGHFPANDSSNEFVVGPSLADQYNYTVGTRVEVNGYALYVSGILDTKVALLNRCLIMPLEVAQAIYNYPESVNIIAVKPFQNISQENLTATIRDNVDYVNALTETERNDIIEPVLAQVQTWNVGIETVVFIISLILVATVTAMSVSERRRDFATLDALGAPTGYVFRVVIIETLFIGLLGGILGIALGSLAAVILASVYTSIPVALFFPSIFEIVPPPYMAEMFAAVLGVCCAAGIIPAISATRIRIAEVLRAEY